MEEIKRIINSELREYNVTSTRILLFGSRAKGTFDEDSDYDILIVLNEDISDELKIKLSCIITRELSNNWVNADIIVKSNSELKYYENCIGSVVRQALLEGVSV